jgi:hypothetical protein
LQQVGVAHVKTPKEYCQFSAEVPSLYQLHHNEVGVSAGDLLFGAFSF